MPPVSLRVAQTETAVIDDLLERYCDVEGLINLAPGAPAVLPSIEVRRAAATAGLGPTASAYGDVLGFEPLRTRWMQTITASWDALWLEREARAGATTKADAYGLELMVTAGANQVGRQNRAVGEQSGAPIPCRRLQLSVVMSDSGRASAC
jgi:hypothetical protein